MNLFHPNDSDSDQWVMDMHVILHSYNVTTVYHKQDVCSHVVAQWCHERI